MNETTPISLETSPLPPTRNAAVQRCCQTRERSFVDSRANRVSSYDTRQGAIDAYRNAMPHLSDFENICDFIACTAHGMIIGAIDSIEGPNSSTPPRLLSVPSTTSQKPPKKPSARPPTPPTQ
jgi:hypothetical protein